MLLRLVGRRGRACRGGVRDDGRVLRGAEQGQVAGEAVYLDRLASQ